ncbi:MAG: hypothetical protein F9K17_15715 [Phycisphaerae bacterium]|nr:MAG: hypothetical protein F9K17_15715 [Phycisphaerae bacterium]
MRTGRGLLPCGHGDRQRRHVAARLDRPRDLHPPRRKRRSARTARPPRSYPIGGPREGDTARLPRRPRPRLRRRLRGSAVPRGAVPVRTMGCGEALCREGECPWSPYS